MNSKTSSHTPPHDTTMTGRACSDCTETWDSWVAARAGEDREMSVLQITNAINEDAGANGVQATHKLVTQVLQSLEGIAFDSGRGKATLAV